MGGHRASGAADDPVDGPVDLAAVRADDALLDAIAGAGPSAARPGAHGAGYGFTAGLDASADVDDDRIAAILAAWKADIEADPMPELVTLDEAVEAVTAGHDARNRIAGRTRRRMPFAIAAAAAVVACFGLTAAVHGSSPGDTLWGVNKVLFAQHASQVQKVHDVRQHIDDANAAIARNDLPAARQALQQAGVGIPGVQQQDQAPLTAEYDRAQRSLTPSAPGALPGTPSSSSTSSTPGRPSGSNPVVVPPGSSATTSRGGATGPGSPTTTTSPKPPPQERSAPVTPPPTTTTAKNGMSSPSAGTSTTTG